MAWHGLDGPSRGGCLAAVGNLGGSCADRLHQLRHSAYPGVAADGPGRLRASRVVIYLGVVAGAYALIGVALLVSLVLFGEQVLSWLSGARESGGVPIIQAALGAGLVWYSLRLDPMTAAGREKKRRREASRGGKDRVTRFRGRAVGDGTQGGIGPLLGLAVAAVGLEVATLIPYLAGIGLIAAASPGAPSSALMLLFYCMVMITPALVLLGEEWPHIVSWRDLSPAWRVS